MVSIADVVIEEIPENDFDQLLKDSFAEQASEGKIVKGIISEITKTHAIIDIGLKSEGFIDVKEIVGSEEPKIGDEIEVFIEEYEGRDGRVRLSYERVLQEKSWASVSSTFAEGGILEGEITGRVKGGFIVEIESLTAFLPGSQVDVKPVRDITMLLGHKEQFKVLKMDDLRGNVVVSRRAILEESHQEAINKVLETIEEGQILDGVVKNITNYGAFIDLGTIDGLVHIADISWSRISHPSEMLSLGQNLKVKVIKYDDKKKQVSLGIKQLEHDPWGDISKNIGEGGKLKGKITNITDYGVFVELQKGIEGLVHLSEISWAKGNANQIKNLSLAQEVEVVILEIDRDKHRISLSIKRATDNPWSDFVKDNKVGDTVTGEIKTVTEYCFYVEVAKNVEALLHFSDLVWQGDAKKAAAEYKKGDKVEAQITELTVEKERLCLSVKHLSGNPFKELEKDLAKDKRVTCTVTEVKNDGIIVEILDSISVFIKRTDLSKDKGDQRSDRFAVGERVDAKIVKFEKDSKKLTLSIKALEVEEEKEAIKEYGSTTSGASLGDILGEALGNSISDKKEK